MTTTLPTSGDATAALPITDAVIRQRAAMVALSRWIPVAESIRMGGVRIVPALFSAPFPTHELWALVDQAFTMETTRVRKAFSWAQRQISSPLSEARLRWGPRLMARFDHCASTEAKHAAAQGRGLDAAQTDYTALWADDPRVFDCICDPESRTVVRPWIEAARTDGYPLEFRLFYGPFGEGSRDGLLGVSSYYPQRAIVKEALPPVIRDGLEDRISAMCEFGNALARERRSPVGFTADFVLDVYGMPWFLEGGPPHAAGPISASSCCFPPGKISGLALYALPGALDH